MTVGDLARECGISKCQAKRIAYREIPIMRSPGIGAAHILSVHEREHLRRLFLAMRPAPVAPAALAAIPRPEPTTPPPSPRQPAQEEKTVTKPHVDSMTIREIAELCEVSESAIRNWIDIAATSAKIAKPSAETAKATNTPFAFSLAETLAIIRAGGKGVLADLLEENAKAKPAASKAARLPAGIQLHELRMIYGPAEAGKRLDLILGYSKTPVPLPAPEPRASDAEAAHAFGELYARIGSRGVRQLSAIAGAIASREDATRCADSMQGRLGL